MTKDEPMVRLGHGVHLPALLGSLGCDPVAIIKTSGFDLKVFENPRNRVSYRRMGEFLSRCVAKTGCGHFGLLIGQYYDLSYSGAAGFAAMSANTVGEALETIREFLMLSDEGGVVSLNTYQGFAQLGYFVLEKDMVGASIIQENGMTGCFKALKGLCGEDWAPTEIWLTQKEPKTIKPYEDFFRSPIRFNAPESTILFRSDCLKQPLSTANKHLHSYLMTLVKEAKQDVRPSLIRVLATHISLALLENEVSLEDISGRVGIHPRTLNRRLKKLGTSFMEIREKIRRETASDLLRNTEMSVAEIAAMLSYSDSTSFNHAFRRWFGVSPRSWEKSNQP